MKPAHRKLERMATLQAAATQHPRNVGHVPRPLINQSKDGDMSVNRKLDSPCAPRTYQDVVFLIFGQNFLSSEPCFTALLNTLRATVRSA